MSMKTIYQSLFHNDKVNVVHEQPSIFLLQGILSIFMPKIIIELGTGGGGMSLVFHEAVPGAEFYSFDISSRIFKADPALFKKNCIFERRNIFKDGEFLKSLLLRKERKFLYCDNGDKKREIKMFAPLLNKGDLVGVHDFGMEIRNKDVVILKDNFKPVGWDLFACRGLSTRLWIKQ